MTIEERTEKKLLEKTNWYKVDSKWKPENEESKIEYNPTPPIKRMRRGLNMATGKKISNNTTNKNSKNKIRL